MDFIWKTEMRPHGEVAPGDPPQLRGQAAATRLGDGRWQLHTMPDQDCFATDAIISDADARTLAHAILRAELPEAWADLVEALAIMGRHPSSTYGPTDCERDRLTVMADPGMFTAPERDRLAELHFEQSNDGDTFGSSRFGSA